MIALLIRYNDITIDIKMITYVNLLCIWCSMSIRRRYRTATTLFIKYVWDL